MKINKLTLIDILAAMILLATISVLISETWPLLKKHFGWTLLSYYGGTILFCLSCLWIWFRAGGK